MLARFATDTGWNLIAIPISISQESQEALAPRGVWEWSGTRFQEAQLITAGKAYWIHQSAARSSTSVTGTPVKAVTRELEAGWNLIGGFGYPPYAALPLPLSVSPSGSISEVWAWENDEYVKLNHIVPGRGAWVFAKRTCTVRLSPNPEFSGINLAYSSGPRQMRLRWATPTDDQPPSSAFSFAVYGAPSGIRSALIAPENLLATRSGSQSAILTSLTGDSAYDFVVVAQDVDGNRSYFNSPTTATVIADSQMLNAAEGGELSSAGASVVFPPAFLTAPSGSGVSTTAAPSR
jgi:hypothetical protein